MNRLTPAGLGAQARSGPGEVKQRIGRHEPREQKTGFRAAAFGFVLMTALVAIAATGVFVLLDPRAQAFWGAKLGDLVAFARSVAGR